MPDPAWGTLSREDAGSTRRTRGLGLGSAVRRMNDLAVPGLGGLWFARPLLWSLLGIHLGRKLGRRPSEVANAIEALACWHALSTPGVGRDARIGGRTKLSRHGAGFVPYRQASRRAFYVTVPMRQGMVQPLRALGLVTGGSQRFNSYELSEQGEGLMWAACGDLRAFKRDIPSALEVWVAGDDGKIHVDGMRDALSPLVPFPAAASSLLSELLLTGEGGNRRKALAAWLPPVDSAVSWQGPVPGLDDEHRQDLREGARFFQLRDTALAVLDAVEIELRQASAQRMALAAAVAQIGEHISRVRAAATLFLEPDRDPTGGVAGRFAEGCVEADDVKVLRFLVERDGRGLRLADDQVRPGVAFRADGASTQADGDPVTPESQNLAAWLPTGTSGRVRNLNSLLDDLARGR
jgi:hypothetical protein